MDQQSQSQVSQFKEAFAILDFEKKGRVGVEEFIAVFKRMGKDVSDSEMKDLIAPFDVEAKSTLDFKQFLSLMQAGDPKDVEKEAREAFALFDSESKGAITAVNLKDVLTKLGDEIELKDVQDIVDEIGDGETVNFDQFLEMMV